VVTTAATPAAVASVPSAPAVNPNPSSGSVLVAAAKQHRIGFGLGIALTVIVLAAAIFGIYSLIHHPSSQPFSRISVEKITTSGQATFAAISPDGKYVAHVAREGGLQGLWLRHIPTNSNTRIVPPVDGRYTGVRFSPDGNYIFFSRYERSQNGIGYAYRIPVLGGSPQVIAKDVDTDVAISPDGLKIAFFRNMPAQRVQNLIIQPVDGGPEQQLLQMDQTIFFSNPAWSPDGKLIAAIISPNPTRLAFFDATSGKEIKGIPVRGFPDSIISWLDNYTVLFPQAPESNRGMPQLATLSFSTGETRQITADANLYRSAIPTADQHQLAAIQQQYFTRLTSVDSATGAAAEISETQDDGDASAVTSDGRILTTAQSGGLYIRKPDGSDRSMISNWSRLAAGDLGLCGQYVLVAGITDDKPLIWRVDLNGAQPLQLSNGLSDGSPVCAPDKKSVFYVDQATGVIREVPLEGGPSRVFSKNPCLRIFDISRDGKYLACHAVTGTNADNYKTAIEIYATSDGSSVTSFPYNVVSTRNARFTPDGKAILTDKLQDGVSNVWVQPLTGGPARQLTHFTDEFIRSFYFTPDGKHIIIDRGHTSSDVVLIQDAAEK